MMLNFTSLPPTNQPFNKEEFLLAREIVECEMEFYLSKNQEKSFEKAYLKCKQFYYDFKKHIPRSEKMLYYTGLFLLHLLANHRYILNIYSTYLL
jgi:hypothetical protein